jgi:hypothetical protein
MQIFFDTNDDPASYALENGGRYPDAPARCPHKDCKMSVTMLKHGFYDRNILTLYYQGRIRIRRYRCPLCGKTVSMIPAFCIGFFEYGLCVIIGVIKSAVSLSIGAATKQWNKILPGISRRHIQYWKARLKLNRKVITYGMIQMSPAHLRGDPDAGDKAWTEFFLNEVSTSPQKFNADFQKITEKSFLSSQFSVA